MVTVLLTTPTPPTIEIPDGVTAAVNDGWLDVEDGEEVTVASFRLENVIGYIITEDEVD